jgi:hypothetical protein
MGQKELKKATEELKPLGSIVLGAVFAPFYWAYVMFLHMPAVLLMLIFGPLLRLFFGPKSNETDAARSKHPRADDRILPTVDGLRFVEPRPKDVLPAELPEGRWEDDGGGPSEPQKFSNRGRRPATLAGELSVMEARAALRRIEGALRKPPAPSLQRRQPPAAGRFADWVKLRVDEPRHFC